MFNDVHFKNNIAMYTTTVIFVDKYPRPVNFAYRSLIITTHKLISFHIYLFSNFYYKQKLF